MSETTIYVIDEFVTRPGEGEALLERYLDGYGNGAAERGMTLERVLVSPPLWLRNQSNVVTVTWTVPSVGAWWQMSFMGRSDPELAAFWEEIGELVETRTRRFATTVKDMEQFSDV